MGAGTSTNCRPACVPRLELKRILCADSSNDVGVPTPKGKIVPVNSDPPADQPPIKPKSVTVIAAPTNDTPVGSCPAAPVNKERRLVLAHFNDIYNIEPASREPVGGAARLAWKVKSMAAENPLVVFSGDAFNPSLLSTITLGAQMPPVLNKIGVHIACIGNHDFDFGTGQLMNLVSKCNFPWLMANVLDKETGKPYANAKATHMMDWNGIKVGFAGLVEQEWLDTLGAVNPNDVEYIDFVEEGRRLAAKLKAQGAELLVAITHMRVPNDRKLASQCPEYHLVMGGHDHHYETDFIPPHNNLMVKSGTDFRDLTRVDVVFPPGSLTPKLSWTRFTMDSKVPEDPETAEIVQSFMGKMGEKMGEVLGESRSDLDGRFSSVRTQESNLGNFIADVVRKATEADMVLINGGTLRSDIIHGAGPFTLGDLMAILPMIDCMVVISIRGAQVIEALENGVSMVPKMEGRFPQVSGVSFIFDPSLPPRQRVLPGSVLVNGEPIVMDRTYKLCTKPYLADGKDGYDVFKQCPVIVPEENGIPIVTAVRNHMRCLQVLNVWDPKVRVHKFARAWSNKSLKKKSTSTLLAASSGPSSNNLEKQATTTDLGDDANDLLPARSGQYQEGTTGLCVLDGKYVIKPVLDGRIMTVDDINIGADEGGV